MLSSRRCATSSCSRASVGIRLFPATLEHAAVLNIEDVPDDLAEALSRAPQPLVACGVCRRLCVRDEFVAKEKHVCAWDFHAQVFGKRGPWREGAYEEHHFETLPSCAYVVPDLLAELEVEIVLTIGASAHADALGLVNALLEHADRPHMAVKTECASGGSSGEMTNRAIRDLATFFVLLFVALGLRQAYVQVIAAPQIASRPNDPRHALLDAGRGRILATDGTVLAATAEGKRTYPLGAELAQTVGYASARYGASGHRSELRSRV